MIGGWRGEHGAGRDDDARVGHAAGARRRDRHRRARRPTVDQCPLSADGRFTLLAPDDYGGDYLDIKLFNAAGGELARESLYDDDGE